MNISKLVILAVESSCDDTGVAVLKGNKELSNLVANQEIDARISLSSGLKNTARFIISF